MKLNVVGMGVTGQAYARAARQAQGIELVSAQNHLPDDAREDSWVFLCAPQPFQFDLATEAVQRGYDVLMPLPVALGEQEAMRLFDIFQQNHRLLVPASVDDYRRTTLDVKKQILQGQIGRPGIAEMKRTMPVMEQEWYRDVRLCGGAVYQALLQDVRIITDWLGKVKTAYGYRRTAQSVDFATLTLEMESGALACIEALWGGREPYRYCYEVTGSKGVIDFDSACADSCRCYTETGEPENADLSMDMALLNPYRLLLEDVEKRRGQIKLEQVRMETMALYQIVNRCREATL